MKLRRYRRKTPLKISLASLLKAAEALNKSAGAEDLLKKWGGQNLGISIDPELVNAVKKHLAENADVDDEHAKRMVAGTCNRDDPDCFG